MNNIVTEKTLGKQITIQADALVDYSKAIQYVTFHPNTIDILIGIGKDNVAHLIMSEEAWQALNNGEEIHYEKINSEQALEVSDTSKV